MSDYIPLDLKYRPRKLDDLIGQEVLVRTLTNAIKANRVRSAFLFIGPWGCGKCVVGDTIVSTQFGPRRIKRLVPNRLDGFSPSAIALPDESGIGLTSHVYREANATTRRITTNDGYEIEGTLAHRVRVLSTSGQYTWKPLGDISTGDVLVINRTPLDWHCDTETVLDIRGTRRPLTLSVCHMLGYLLSEGQSRTADGRIQITSEDEHVIACVNKAAQDLSTLPPRVYHDKRTSSTKESYLHSESLTATLAELGFDCLSHDKYIPDIVLSLSRTQLAAVLCAYFDGDGGVDGCSVSATSTSHRLLSDMQSLLLLFGVLSRVKVTHKSCTNCADRRKHDYWKLVISGQSLLAFREHIGFLSPRKQTSLDAICADAGHNPNLDVIVGLKRTVLAWKRQMEVVDNGTFKCGDNYVRAAQWASNCCLNASNSSDDISWADAEKVKHYFSYCRTSLLDVCPADPRIKIASLAETTLAALLSRRDYFDMVETITAGVADVFDVTKEGEDKSFYANGFINHNTSAARVLAACLNSPGGETPNPKSSPEVDAIFEGKCVDVVELDAASNKGIDDIRDIKKEAGYRAVNCKYKVFIIDEVHALTPAAFEALLKTLEEPPSYCKIILCTTESHKIKPTIWSRCQDFTFSTLRWNAICAHLNDVCKKEKVVIDEESLKLISKRAAGHMRDALKHLDSVIMYAGADQPITRQTVESALGVCSDEVYFNFVDAVLTKNVTNGMKAIQALMSNGQTVGSSLMGLMDHLRTLLVISCCETTAGLVSLTDEEKAKYLHQRGLMKLGLIDDMINNLITIHRGLFYSVSPQVLLEQFLFKSIKTHHRLSSGGE